MDIIRVIQETATWIEKVNNDFNTNLFRTPELSPHYYYCEISLSGKISHIDQINLKRAELLIQSGVELIPVAELHKYGRVMIFDADSTVVDGAAEMVSACYIDGFDTPPWDTWLAIGEQLNCISFYKRGYKIDNAYLIGWVPKSHYFYANQALEVACIDNFAWPTNKFIESKYDLIKDLFNKPDTIDLPSEVFDYYKMLPLLEIVEEELIKNFK